MKATFQDLQEESNSLNGSWVCTGQELDSLLGSLKDREPFFFELAGENNKTLLIGFAPGIGCAQYGASDGEPPYLMAISNRAADSEPYANFLTGNTPTPIPKRYCLPIERIRGIITEFLEHGRNSGMVEWEEVKPFPHSDRGQ